VSGLEHLYQPHRSSLWRFGIVTSGPDFEIRKTRFKTCIQDLATRFRRLGGALPRQLGINGRYKFMILVRFSDLTCRPRAACTEDPRPRKSAAPAHYGIGRIEEKRTIAR
jgi:hypothetical protein